MPQQNQIQMRRDTASNWTIKNPILASGEMGLETDTKLVKIGDGITAWSSLGYAASSKVSPLRVLPPAQPAAEQLLEQAAFWIDAAHSSANGQSVSNLGSAGSVLNATVGSSSAVDSNDPKFLDWNGVNYIYCLGLANSLTVGDAAALDITGDLDIRAKVAMDDWTPAANSYILLKWDFGSNRSYALRLETDGTLRLMWTTDGTNATLQQPQSTVATGLQDGATKWVRATLDVDNGAGGWTAAFYTSDDGVTWTQLGNQYATSSGTTSIFSGTANVQIGGVVGKYYNAQIFNGINGAKVLDVDTSVITSGSISSFNALTGQQVIFNRATSGSKITAVTNPLWLFGTDDYMSVNNRYVAKDNDKHVRLWGVSGSLLSVPDATNLDIVGDIDVRIKVALDDWTPATTQILFAKYVGGGNQRSWYLYVGTSGNLGLLWSEDGAAVKAAASTVALSVADNTAKWLRATLDVDNGSSGNTVTFYTSDDGATWTQLGATVVTAGITSIYSSTATVAIGTRSDSAADFSSGKFYQAQLFDGIAGTKVLDINTAIASNTASTFTAITGQTVTISGADVLSGQSVYFPGVAGNYLTSPDANVLDITGDIDIRVQAAMDDWTPSAFQYLTGKWSSSGTQSSFGFRITAAGMPEFLWTTDGATPIVKTGNTAVGAADGSIKWVRVTLDVDNGASGNDVKFYTSDNGTVWTQLGSTITTAGVTSIYSSTAVLEIGALGNGAINPLQGRVLRTQIYNGIGGTKVFDANMGTLTSLTQTTFTEQSSNAATVTINRSGTGYVTTPIVDAGYVLPTGVVNLSPSNVDYLNFTATESLTALAFVRTWATPVNAGGYITKSIAGSAGWAVYNQSTAFQNRVYITDGVNTVATNGSTVTAGATAMYGQITDRTANTIAPVTNTTIGSTSSVAAVGSIANTSPLRIGSFGGSTGLNDFEGVGFAVFRRALTSTEIATIYNYYAGRSI